MTNRHMEFAESLRKIMRNTEQTAEKNDQQKNCEKMHGDTRSLQEMLEAKFNELFGSFDDDD